MVNQNLILSIEDEDIERQLGNAFNDLPDDLGDILFPPEAQSQNYSIDSMVSGTIVRIDNDHVIVDVGFKSEATIPRNEWTEEDPPEVGQGIDVLIEDLEGAQGGGNDSSGLIQVSKKRADQRKIWVDVISRITEGDIVTGKCQRKIKGGLLVDIGVSVFLPASQVDIRRPGDIGDYIDRVVQCEVLKIDDVRKNIVVSRRSLIEKERTYAQQKLMADLEKGQVRKGVVKNIADFGAFVDLGGIDGLLHITDMSHTRISKPSEMVKLDQEIDVMILNVDREKVKIALGLKQLLPNPWDHVEEKYPVGSIQNGEVVNVLPYGAFVKLEPQTGDEIQVSVLKIDRQGEQMSLGMKQTQDNPWDKVESKYPIGKEIDGRVRNLTNYGAFIELEEGIDGLLHVSDMSWTRKISHPSEVLEKGQALSCKILAVDIERHRIALGLKQMNDDPWSTDIPDRYQPGQLIKGKITKITNFGVFVGLEDGLEGLLHVSELSDEKVENPEDLVSVGDEVEVKVLRVDTDERKIGLSKRRVAWSAEQEAAAAKQETTDGAGVIMGVPEAELKGGLGDSGPLIKPAE